MITTTVYYKGCLLTVEYDYQPEEPMVMYYSDGSGYPGCPEEFIINSIFLGDQDVSELLEDQFEDIEKAIYKEWESNKNDY